MFKLVSLEAKEAISSKKKSGIGDQIVGLGQRLECRSINDTRKLYLFQ